MLRAINVGGHVVPMARLRELFASLEHSDVATVIASGNVLFTTRSGAPEQLERRIEAHLHQALGYEAATFLRSARELADIVAHRPFPAEEPVVTEARLEQAVGGPATARNITTVRKLSAPAAP